MEGWQSLKPYKIVTVSGYQFVNRYMDGFNTFPVGSVEAALQFVELKRADIFVAASVAIGDRLKERGEASPIKRLEPPVDYLNLYTFFAGQYAEYAKEYEMHLKRFQKEGEYDPIFFYE